MAAASSPPEPFDLSGGALPLDFANTWSDRARPESDALRDFGEVVRFARETGVLSDERAERLQRAAARDRKGAVAALGRARALREAIYAVFAARARDRTVAPDALAAIERAIHGALPHLRLVPQGERFAWTWDEAGAAAADLDAPLWPIARAAADLLVAPDLAQVRECDGERCTWLFLDHSRGRSRRWCSMASCGNRAKARRHYQRRTGA